MLTQHRHELSRRTLIKHLSLGVAATGAGLILPSALASPSDQLSFRVNQPELLLHFNENSLGMSPKAMNAALQAIGEYGNRYPHDLFAKLQQTLAEKHGVEKQQIILGNGSTEIIAAIVTLASKKNATIIEPSPTFGGVRHLASSHGLKTITVDTDKNFVTSIASLKKRAESISGTKLINICNPNNPTGTIVDQQALEDWLRTAPADCLFLIDEAYFEYAKSNPNYASPLSLIKRGRENIIVTRTFSKIYAMAGMRIGYAIAAPETASQLNKFSTDFNLSVAGIAAALASIEDDAFYKQSLKSNQKGKEILTTTLKELKLPYIESDTNFVLHRINSDLASYSNRMKINGIRVGRRMTKEDGWNRVSIGKPDEMKIFRKTLLTFREKGWV